MSFLSELEAFQKTHFFQHTNVNGVEASYLLCGNPDSRYTLVYLVGGTGLSTVWFHHILEMENDYRILTFDYPMELENLEEVADFSIALTEQLKLENLVFIGASLGGFIGQLIARKHPDKVAGLGLFSTCSLSENSINDLKKQYRIYGLLYVMTKILPYSWLKKLFCNISKKQIGLEDESPEDKKYMEDLFEWVYSNYTRAFDLHMTGLCISVTSLTPITPAQFHEISDRTLLVLPKDDKAFSKEAQRDLLEMLPDARLVRINGGHTATLYRVEEYVKATREFLDNL